VNYLDLNLIGDRVQANPRAFGLQSAGASTSADVPPGAPTISSSMPTMSTCLRGFAIVGPLCRAPARGAAPPGGAGRDRLARGESFGQALENRLDLASADEAGEGPPLRLFFGADYGQRDVERR
jgi:hypothetical protein